MINIGISAIIISIFLQMIDITVTGFIDAMIYTIHDSFLKPLITTLLGYFMIGDDMFGNSVVGVLMNVCYKRVLIVGVCIMLLIAIWQLFKTMFAYLGTSNVEEGWKIGAKVIMFGFLITNAKEICEKIILGPCTEIMTLIGGIPVKSTSVGTIATKASSTVANLIGGSEAGGMGAVAEMLFTFLENAGFGKVTFIGPLAKFVVIIMIDIKLVKIAVNLAEKYMNIVFLIIISPVGFACGVSKSTNKFFNKWVGLFASAILVQMVQYIMLALLNVLVRSSLYGGVTTNSDFKVILVILGILSIGENASTIVDELGFSSIGESGTNLGGFASGLNKGATALIDMGTGRVPMTTGRNFSSNKEISVSQSVNPDR